MKLDFIKVKKKSIYHDKKNIKKIDYRLGENIHKIYDKNLYLDYLKNEYLQLNVKNTWVDISQRKIYQWPINTKKYSTSLIIMEMQIKSQWAITTHPLDWLKLRLTVPNVSENMEQSVLSYIAYKNVKMEHLPDWFGRFLKTALLKYNLKIIKFIHFKCAV